MRLFDNKSGYVTLYRGQGFLANIGKLERLATISQCCYVSKMLGENELRQFAKLWQEEFGEKLSTDKARREAMLLLELYALLSAPNGSDPSAARQ